MSEIPSPEEDDIRKKVAFGLTVVGLLFIFAGEIVTYLGAESSGYLSTLIGGGIGLTGVAIGLSKEFWGIFWGPNSRTKKINK
jgi:hypothetical protein